MKKLGILFATVIMIMLFALSASAKEIVDSGECGAEGDNVTWVLYDDGELVISGNGEMKNYHNYYGEDSPFMKLNIKTVIVENGIKNIGNYLFDHCRSIETVILPDSIEKIGVRAFYFCENLTDVKMPKSIEIIENRAFYDCSKLSDMCLPDGLKYIASLCFYNTRISEVVIPDSVDSIYDGAFSYSDIASIEIPNSVTYIGSSVFSGCNKLKYISIPDSVEQINSYTFGWCSSLEKIEFGKSLKFLSADTFDGCGSLNEICISTENPFLVVESSNIVFNKNKTKLVMYPCARTDSKYVVPDSVVTIGSRAFWRCNNLKEIVLGSETRIINESAFYECYNLEVVKFNNKVEFIGDSAFSNCGFKQILLPDSVTHIGEGAFENCYNMITVKASDSVTHIGAKAFKSCYQLTSIEIPKKITNIYDYTFYGCSQLKNIVFSTNLEFIGDYAFGSCGFKQIAIPKGVLEIGCNAFEDCQDLAEIDLPDSLNYIGAEAFDDTKWFFDQKDGIVYVGNILYKYAGVLAEGSEIILPSNIEIIAPKAFYNQSGLNKVVFPENLVYIGDQAFDGCVNLNEISLPESIKRIGSDAFSNTGWYNDQKNGLLYLNNFLIDIKDSDYIYNEETIVLKDSTIGVADGAFKYIRIKTLFIPENLKYIYFNHNSIYYLVESFDVDINNKYFSNDEYGVLYDKNKTKLLMCSSKAKENYKIPEGVIEICDYSIFFSSSFYEIHIPSSVNKIGNNAFGYIGGKGDGGDGFYEGVPMVYDVIYYDGSYEQWNQVLKEGNNYYLENGTLVFLVESEQPHSHSYTAVTIAEPTCTTAGTTTYTCTCGDTYTETIPATNHANATTDAGKAPTTTEVGYTAGKYCPDCKIWIEGHTEIPKLEEHKHSYTPTTTKEATCWREGEKTYTCTCGESYTEAIAKLDHEYRPWETKKNPTCTEPGLEWSYCLICDNDFEREIPATGHTIIDYTRRATPDSDGAYVTACDVCNEVFKSISFGRPTEYKLSTTKYTYDGKTKTPKLTVETSDGVVLKEGVDYELELPSGRKAVGVYTYRVVFKGNFLGEKKVSYQILPGKTSKITATQSTSSIKLTWKKVPGADGYRVYQYNSKTGKYEKIKTLTGTSYTVKKLKAGTTYKFAVKAYSKADGETLWAASSVSIKTATKPATPTVKATAGSKQATISWNKVTGATGYVIYMQDEFGDYEKLGSTKKTSYTRKKLTKGKTYYFRVRAYKTVDGKNIYGGYKTVKVKVK